MRWARYELNGKAHLGIVEEDRIFEVRGGLFDAPDRTGQVHRVGDVRWLPPVIPPTFYAAGMNYMTHCRKHPEVPVPQQADPGYRAVNALIGHEENIVIPRESAGKLQFEGELVVVIGKKAKRLTEANAMSCVFGYSIGNDVSERAWQRTDRTLWRAKDSDTFHPMGPWIETDVDLDAMVTRVRLNGVEVSNFRTNDMIFNVPQFLVSMTRFKTLYPGDMLWMGTDEPTLDMVAGDVCEVDLSGIGVLRNRLVAEA